MGRFAAFLLFITAALSAHPSAAGDTFNNVPAVIGVDSNISVGKFDMGDIAKEAESNGIRVVILTDHVLSRGEYGLWPLRNIFKKVIEQSGILRFGPRRYLDAVSYVNKTTPGVLLIGACDVAPFYYWSGFPFSGFFVVNDWSKQLLVIGLDDPHAYRDMPMVANSYAAKKYGIKSVLKLWPLALSVFGFILFNRRIFNYVCEDGRERGPVSSRLRRLGAALIVLGLIFAANNYPFDEGQRFDQYHGEQGAGPYQRVIDYVNARGGMTFWSGPENTAMIHARFGMIGLSTLPWVNDLFATRDYTGSALIYGESRTIHEPGREWDKLLNDYCGGVRSRPCWALAEAYYRKPGQDITSMQTMLLLKDVTRQSVYDALKSGRMYALTRWNKDQLALREFSVSGAGGQGTAIMGGELDSPDGKVKVRAVISYINPDNAEATVRVIKNGELFDTFMASGPDVIYEKLDEVSGVHRKNYYRIVIDGQCSQIISNPIFVKK